MIVNADEPYQVSHPVDGGDATLTIGIDPVALHELAPPQYLSAPGRLASNCRVLRIDAHTQITAAQLRQRLVRCTINPAAAETVALDLIRHTLSANGSHTARNRDGRPQRMVDRVKLLLSADPSRKWALEEIAQYIGVTPVYLTDAFRRVEGIPFYRYHIRLRLVHSLAVLADYDTVESLAHRFGFHSHSHFSSAFKQAFQQTPSEFKRSISPGGSAGLAHREIRAVDDARVYVSRALRASKPFS
ncbi:AraC family transcriptional regulator [Mycobacterium paraterrae]|uniref:AraC family transcriptional regulator n=1 Tax=Mycobacterium paraterrae TaxID=577492 RepID=A0ABY3VK12_9MYCO|nr:AraC family transcriptional regulator [Mycobacterium paraterrae]UMB69745.1 AraC family transcriptional regulator [Mycobacterium paraterrae]